jgi:hypothetical protein
MMIIGIMNYHRLSCPKMASRLRVVIEDDELPYGTSMIQECTHILRDKYGFDVVTFGEVYKTPDLGKTVLGAIVFYRGSDIRPIYRANDLHLFPNLKFVGTMGIGVDHLDVKALEEAGVAVGNTPLVVGDGPADLAFALILASARNFKQGEGEIGLLVLKIGAMQLHWYDAIGVILNSVIKLFVFLPSLFIS